MSCLQTDIPFAAAGLPVGRSGSPADFPAALAISTGLSRGFASPDLSGFAHTEASLHVGPPAMLCEWRQFQFHLCPSATRYAASKNP